MAPRKNINKAGILFFSGIAAASTISVTKDLIHILNDNNVKNNNNIVAEVKARLSSSLKFIGINIFGEKVNCSVEGLHAPQWPWSHSGHFDSFDHARF